MLGPMLGLMSPHIIIGYVFLALLVGIGARNRQIGFWGFFILSLILTPIVTGIFVIICTPKKTRRPAKA
jgi:hypothetical protein